MKYTVFERDTGRILRLYDVYEDEIELNTGPGEGFVEGEFKPETHYVADGQAVPFPERPGPLWAWDFAASSWIDEEAERLPDLRAEGSRKVNAAASRERDGLITPLLGQDTVYALKREEAAAFVADPDPEPSHYPLVFAEVGTTAGTPFEVAQVFLNMSAIAVAALAGIEGRRLAALAAVAAASSAADIDAAVASFAG